MKNSFVILLIICTLVMPTGASASAFEPPKYISRGEAVSRIVRFFDLGNREKSFLNDCKGHMEECFFVFGTMSHFDDITYNPLILYPDVSIAYLYYDDINIATMLGLVHGYLEEKNSPFYPRAVTTRIQALKVIFGAAQLLPWKEKFELMAQLGGENNLKKQKSVFRDLNADNEHMWWYFRYLDFALDAGIITNESYFRPDEPVSETEFEYFLERTMKLASKIHR